MIPLRDTVSTRSWPVVTWALIFLNVWVFFYDLLLGPELEAFIQTWGFVPARHFLWWAHVGGFVVGMLPVPIFRRPWSYPRVWRDQYAPW